jgi:glycosyltransferase involved in cell wall biosynthesis
VASDKGSVLLISPQPFFQWRGSPIRVRFDALALARAGCEVDLLTLPIGERVDLPGVRVLRVPNLPRRRDIPIGPSPWKILFDALLLLRGLVLIARRHYRVIHGIEDAGILAWVLARLGRARLVFEKHSDPDSYRGGGSVRRAVLAAYRAVERFVVRRADAVIGTGPGLCDQARRLGATGPVHHVPDIPSSLVEAESDQVRAVRAELIRAPDDRLAMYVGSFAAYQGMDLLFAAIPLVLRRESRARFVIIGGTPAEIAARRAELERLGAADRVLFPGKVHPDRLPAFLAASDVLLSPRLAGLNTPLKLLDYLKAGRAVAATDNTANRQILDERVAVFAAPEPAAFAAAVADLLADDARRERLGAEGRRRVQELYNFEEFARRLAACYAGLPAPAVRPDRRGA